MDKNDIKNIGDYYWAGVVITGVLSFIGILIYALMQWGLLIGLLFGWIPALIGGLILGFIWPLVAIVLIIFIAASVYVA